MKKKWNERIVNLLCQSVFMLSSLTANSWRRSKSFTFIKKCTLKLSHIISISKLQQQHLLDAIDNWLVHSNFDHSNLFWGSDPRSINSWEICSVLTCEKPIEKVRPWGWSSNHCSRHLAYGTIDTFNIVFHYSFYHLFCYLVYSLPTSQVPIEAVKLGIILME